MSILTQDQIQTIINEATPILNKSDLTTLEVILKDIKLVNNEDAFIEFKNEIIKSFTVGIISAVPLSTPIDSVTLNLHHKRI